MAAHIPLDDSFPTDGITLGGVRAFLAPLGDIGARTTEDVVRGTLIPLTATPQPGAAYTAHLRATGSPSASAMTRSLVPSSLAQAAGP